MSQFNESLFKRSRGSSELNLKLKTPKEFISPKSNILSAFDKERLQQEKKLSDNIKLLRQNTHSDKMNAFNYFILGN